MKREEALGLWNQVKDENPFEACCLKAYEAEHLNNLIVALVNKVGVLRQITYVRPLFPISEEQ